MTVTPNSDRIVSAEVIDISTRYPREIGRNAVLGWHGAGQTTRAVVLRTEAGRTAWGPIVGRPHPVSVIQRSVADLIDPASGLIDDSSAWCEIALWDLLGRIRDRPVHALLGDHGSNPVVPYDASIYFDDLDPVGAPRGLDAIVDNVRQGWDAGFRAFKLKIGRGFSWMGEAAGHSRDVEAVRLVRTAFPDARLLVDGNNGFTVEGTLRLLDDLGDIDLFWIEEPFHEHRNGLERVRRWIEENESDLLVADGEYRYVVDDVLEFARDGLIDVLLMDVLDFGITAWLDVATRLAGTKAQISPHAWGLPLKSMYASQLAVALPNVPCIEGVRGETLGVDTSGYALREGRLAVPDDPGFGIPIPSDISSS